MQQTAHATQRYGTLLVATVIWALLFWQHVHDGVPSHHLLQRSDLPSVSNWWGALLLPALCWILVGRLNKRVSSHYPLSVIAGFLISILLGVAFSSFFVLGFLSGLFTIMIGILLLALVFPIYRAECFLGFVLANFYTFGAVIPMTLATIFAVLGVIIYRFLRPVVALPLTYFRD